MTIFNRIDSLYSYCSESSLEKRLEWGFKVMRSYRIKQMREDIALAKT
ncbi:MAG: hypothetical protein K5679_05320 [Lachnospiraceae bacterium]|nr:hypothetical protein [Lachnospiraceae bacterium]